MLRPAAAPDPTSKPSSTTISRPDIGTVVGLSVRRARERSSPGRRANAERGDERLSQAVDLVAGSRKWREFGSEAPRRDRLRFRNDRRSDDVQVGRRLRVVGQDSGDDQEPPFPATGRAGRGPMKWNALAEQSSSLCKALSVIGDRWTLLILNQCFLKLRRYGEIQSSLGLSKPLLAARLKKMVRLGVLKKVPCRKSARVHAYLLTETGRQLYPVLLALVRWGNALLIEEARPSIRGHVPCGRRR